MTTTTVPRRTQTNLTTRQAAERLGVTIGTLANWRCSGVGPDFLRINGFRILYRSQDLDEYEARSRVEAIG